MTDYTLFPAALSPPLSGDPCAESVHPFVADESTADRLVEPATCHCDHVLWIGDPALLYERILKSFAFETPGPG
jgi:hypothetical protein